MPARLPRFPARELVLLLAAALLPSGPGPAAARADDWPQWMGPARDGVWRERGVVGAMPAAGLPVKWRAEVRAGYSGPAVADGRVYLLDYDVQLGTLANNPGARTELTGRERVLCFDAATGRLLWKHEYDRAYSMSYASGPRCTPTVAGGRVYALGGEGDLTCLDAATGAVLWSRELRKDYAAPTPLWGFCGHPLVDGDRLVCLVGGPGSVAVAFDRHTGREIWKALSASESGYCPPSIIEAAGVRQLLIWDADNLNALDPATGTVLWTQPLKPAYGMSIMAPRVGRTAQGQVLFASGIGRVGALFTLSADKPGAKISWRGDPKSAIYCANSTPFIAGDTLYGCDCETGFLTAAELATGRRLWETGRPTMGDRRGRHGTAFLVRQGDGPGDDRTWLFSETGDLILARLTPAAYEELGRMHLLEPTNECFGREVVWSHPAFAGRCVFARNDRELVCVSLAE
jgi:outer membrane protein assembly factor BamB